jgi:hypothetical protein
MCSGDTNAAIPETVRQIREDLTHCRKTQRHTPLTTNFEKVRAAGRSLKATWSQRISKQAKFAMEGCIETQDSGRRTTINLIVPTAEAAPVSQKQLQTLW